MSDLQKDYDRAGFGGGLEFGDRPALIVIDTARAYFEPDAPLYIGKGNAEAVLTATADLVATARASGVPVIWTAVRYIQGGTDGGVFFRKVPALRCFEAGNRLGEFMPPLSPQANEVVIVKQYASSFFGTSLASTLTAQRIDTLVISGVSTSGCVRATALDACQHGFVPVLDRDACGDRSTAVQEANLFDLQNKYAEVRSHGDVVAYFRSFDADPNPS